MCKGKRYWYNMHLPIFSFFRWHRNLGCTQKRLQASTSFPAEAYAEHAFRSFIGSAGAASVHCFRAEEIAGVKLG